MTDNVKNKLEKMDIKKCKIIASHGFSYPALCSSIYLLPKTCKLIGFPVFWMGLYVNAHALISVNITATW